MGRHTIKKPLNFSSSEEYEKWKRKQKEEKDKLEQEESPSFNLYRFYFTHIVNRSRIKAVCVIADETEEQAREVFEHWVYFYDFDRPKLTRIVEVFWLQKNGDIHVNFAYNHKEREIIEVYREDYLEYYWNHLD